MREQKGFSRLFITAVLAIAFLIGAAFTLTLNSGTALADSGFNSTFDLALGTGTGLASDYNFDGTVLTINNGAKIEVMGTVSDGRRIEVAANATAHITLNDVTIAGLGSNQSPAFAKQRSECKPYACGK